MTNTQKITIGVGTVLVLAIIAYIIYKRQWKTFVNIGDSRYLPTRYNDARLGLQMESADHGLKVGDNIDIDHDNSVTAKGRAKVLEVVEKGGLPFVITNLKAPATNPDFAGKVRIVN